MDRYIGVGNKLSTLARWLDCAVQRSQARKLCRHARNFVDGLLVSTRCGYQIATPAGYSFASQVFGFR